MKFESRRLVLPLLHGGVHAIEIVHQIVPATHINHIIYDYAYETNKNYELNLLRSRETQPETNERIQLGHLEVLVETCSKFATM